MTLATRMSLFTLASALSLAAADEPAQFDRFFTPRTMRVDYLRTGGTNREEVKLDRVAVDGDWAGSRTHLIDDTNLGDDLFEVFDGASGRLIYSRGIGSIYEEWKTTAEFRSRTRTFEESLRFPFPKAPVHIVLKRRNADNQFEEFWSTTIDPRRESIAARQAESHRGEVWTLVQNGPPSSKVDILLISAGYRGTELPKFRADAKRLVADLFSREPFKSRRADFNVRALDLASERSAVMVEDNVFGLQRYLLTYDNRALRDVARSAPYDVLELLVNSREYGGGGIFNVQGTVAVDGRGADDVFVHEFAHNLAALGDEYTGNVTYEAPATRQVEPWEPNLTALKDGTALKWRDLVEPGTPLPTPLSLAGKVGAFEGGGYRARGIFRPEAMCLMGSSSAKAFCRVCQRAVNRAIDMYVK
jgi:IgA Peptidase M64/Peptidase M64 N-terminus